MAFIICNWCTANVLNSFPLSYYLHCYVMSQPNDLYPLQFACSINMSRCWYFLTLQDAHIISWYLYVISYLLYSYSSYWLLLLLCLLPFLVFCLTSYVHWWSVLVIAPWLHILCHIFNLTCINFVFSSSVNCFWLLLLFPSEGSLIMWPALHTFIGVYFS